MSRKKWHDTIFEGLRNRMLSPRDSDTDGLLYWRERILVSMLFFGVVTAALVILPVIPLAIEKNLWGLLVSDLLCWAGGVAVLVSPWMGYKNRARCCLVMMYGVGVVITANVGFLSGGPAWLFGFAVMAGVLLGNRAAWIGLVLNFFALAILAALQIKGVTDPSRPFFTSNLAGIAAGVNFMFLNALVSISVSVMVKGLLEANDKEKRLTASLREKQALLESEIRERHQAQAALGESESRYRNILESIEDGYFEVDIAGNMAACNDALCRILGYPRDELIGMNNRSYMDIENAGKVYETFNRVYRTGVPTKAIDWQLIKKDGSVRLVETVVSLVRDAQGRGNGFRGIARDVTERTRLEQRLRQAHKMESIGRLAGGIAHDFNNVLYIIMGNAELAMDGMSRRDRPYESLEIIKSATIRAAGIVKQLLNFSRDAGPELKPVELVSLFKEEVTFLRSTLPTMIDIQPRLPEPQVPVMADPVRIKQMLINLATNAAQAMGDTGGVLGIGVEFFTLTEAHHITYPHLSPGRYAGIRISDTGPGIPSADMDKIFDPYFTTREVGQGSGMGLAVVHGIVLQHKGAISVDSKPGRGTVFQVLLPLTDQLCQPDTALPDALGHCSGRLLIVDDEEMLVRANQTLLERMGYRVEAFTDPLEALACFRSDPDQFDLIVTDMTMPGMNGSQLAESVRHLRPGLPVIVCTGHSDLADQEQVKDPNVSAFIAKPVAVRQLAHTIHTLLATPEDRPDV